MIQMNLIIIAKILIKEKIKTRNTGCRRILSKKKRQKMMKKRKKNESQANVRSKDDIRGNIESNYKIGINTKD